MKLTVEQALAFVAATSKGAPKIVLDAWLGVDRTPTKADFKTDDPARRENADEYLDVLQSVLDTLVEHLRNLPRQSTFFDGAPAMTTSNAVTALIEKKITISKPGAKTQAAAEKKKPTQKTAAKKTPVKKAPAKKTPTQKKATKKKAPKG